MCVLFVALFLFLSTTEDPPPSSPVWDGDVTCDDLLRTKLGGEGGHNNFFLHTLISEGESPGTVIPNFPRTHGFAVQEQFFRGDGRCPVGCVTTNTALHVMTKPDFSEVKKKSLLTAPSRREEAR